MSNVQIMNCENLQPFDLDKALKGNSPVCTRMGKVVDGVKLSKKGKKIHAYIGGEKYSWQKTGKYSLVGEDHMWDLFMVPGIFQKTV